MRVDDSGKDVSRTGMRGFLERLRKILLSGDWWPPVAILATLIYWRSVAGSIPEPISQVVQNPGEYGDSFGKLTSTFTALGFGGLIVTLLLQQRQIRMQQDEARSQRERDAKAQYEDVLFRLLDKYREILDEVQVGASRGRTVLRDALARVDEGLIEDGVNGLPRALLSRVNSGTLTENDLKRIDYLHYRNFRIVSVETNPQNRLVDTFEILLEHMCDGAPDHLLIETYKKLVFAQITYLEERYFFLVALSHPSRARLRDLLSKTGFLDNMSRSQIHWLHRDMYEKYWGEKIGERERAPSLPMSAERVRDAFRAHRAAGGQPRSKYVPLGVRRSENERAMGPAAKGRASN